MKSCSVDLVAQELPNSIHLFTSPIIPCANSHYSTTTNYMSVYFLLQLYINILLLLP